MAQQTRYIRLSTEWRLMTARHLNLKQVLHNVAVITRAAEALRAASTNPESTSLLPRTPEEIAVVGFW